MATTTPDETAAITNSLQVVRDWPSVQITDDVHARQILINLHTFHGPESSRLIRSMCRLCTWIYVHTQINAGAHPIDQCPTHKHTHTSVLIVTSPSAWQNFHVDVPLKGRNPRLELLPSAHNDLRKVVAKL